MADETRERILEAASTIILESGLDGLTMEAAADMAGVSRKTIYNHFESRNVLLDEAAAAWIRGTLVALQEVAGSADLPFVEKLNAVLERGLADMRQGSRILTGRRMLASSRLAVVRQELLDRLRGFIEGIVRAAMDEGMVRSDFDPRRLTVVLMNVIVGLATHEGFEDEPFSKADILKDSLRALVGGIQTPKGKAAMRGSPIFA